MVSYPRIGWSPIRGWDGLPSAHGPCPHPFSFPSIIEAHHLIFPGTDDLRPRDKREGPSKRPASPSPSPQPTSRQRKDPSAIPEVDPSLAYTSQQLVQPPLTQHLSTIAEPSGTQEQDIDPPFNDDLLGRMFIGITSPLSLPI
jgi:hypothetical protein